MDRNTKKSYLMQFVAQGVDIEQAYKLVYADEADIAAFDSDEALQEEIRMTRIELAQRMLSDYSQSMASAEVRPADLLKRIQALVPEAFKPQQQAAALPMDLNLTIVKHRGKLEA